MGTPGRAGGDEGPRPGTRRLLVAGAMPVSGSVKDGARGAVTPARPDGRGSPRGKSGRHPGAGVCPGFAFPTRGTSALDAPPNPDGAAPAGEPGFPPPQVRPCRCRAASWPLGHWGRGATGTRAPSA